MDQKKIKYLKFDSLRRFGVELEIGSEVKKKTVKSLIDCNSSHESYVSRYALSNNNKYWHIKDDATCGSKGRYGPKGVEVASFIGSGNQDIDHISNIASVLHNNGCRVNDNCGLHIHAEVADLQIDQISVIISYWIKLEKILGMSLPARRHKSEHCKFMFMGDQNYFGLKRNEKYDKDQFWSLICPKNLSYFNNDDRRFNLNLVNLVRAIRDDSPNRRTIELRWPEGTLDSRDIRCWVRLFLSFIEKCKDKNMPKDLSSLSLLNALRILGLHHENSNFMIYSENVNETKTWFLERIIQHCEATQTHHGEDSKKILSQTKNILNMMWSPIRNYA